jgi:cobalamin-dependent methionine synthase I
MTMGIVNPEMLSIYDEIPKDLLEHVEDVLLNRRDDATERLLDFAENVKGDYDFIISRAVTNMPDFVSWVKDKIKKINKHELKNGILYLKGGDLTEELKDFPKATEYGISDFFDNEFFETKKVVHLPLKFKA